MIGACILSAKISATVLLILLTLNVGSVPTENDGAVITTGVVVSTGSYTLTSTLFTVVISDFHSEEDEICEDDLNGIFDIIYIKTYYKYN